jgi:hypothetical protein
MSAAAAAAENADVDSVVMQYLRRKGYKKAAEALTSERGAMNLRAVAQLVAGDAQVVQQIALHDSLQYTTERYNQSYSLFASWVLSSLDMYKVTSIVKKKKKKKKKITYNSFLHSFF